MVLPGLERDEVLRVTLDEEGDFQILGADEAPTVMTGSELYGAFFGLDGRYPQDIEESLRRYGFLSGNPYRTDEEDQEMESLRDQLTRVNLLPSWEPAPRENRPRSGSTVARNRRSWHRSAAISNDRRCSTATEGTSR
jgi:hypothetical protein